MRAIQNFACAVSAVFLQAIVLTILSYRITCSPLRSASHAHLSFHSRLKLISVTTYLLWASFVTGWIFPIMTTLLVAAVDFSEHEACKISFFFCAYFYGFAKMPIYIYLIERAHVVRGVRRSRDWLYLLNLLILVLFAVIFAFLPQHRLVAIRDGKCYLGVARVVSIPVVVFDVVANIFWGCQFVLPIMRKSSSRLSVCSDRKHFSNDPILNLAYRTAWATLGTCALSTCNIVSEVVLNGREEAYVLLLTCSFDVVSSCVILHLATQSPRSDTYDRQSRRGELDPERSIAMTIQTSKPVTANYEGVSFD